MKNITFLILLAGFLFACRKDNSTSLAPSGGSSNPPTTKGDKCLVLSSINENSIGNTVKYQLDSVISELNYGANSSANIYLIQETTKKFICTQGTKDLKNAKYRLYLNSDGAVEKEIAVTLNSDGKTFTENPNRRNLYTYNSKKQLIKTDMNLSENDDSGICYLTYDEKNRIKEVLTYDENNVLFFKYSNFVHSDVKITNNLFELAFAGSVGMYFIPSLRNTYITYYETSFPNFPDIEPDTFSFDYKFKNGVLTQVTGNYVVYGVPFGFTNDLTFACK